MADLTGVGSILVIDDVISARSDSNDAGDVPDISTATAIVTMTPVGIPATRPYLIIGGDPVRRVTVEPVKCFLADGKLWRVADGSEPAEGETPSVQGVPLLAPKDPSLDLGDWYWQAAFEPPVGARWARYTIPFTGEPGETVSLPEAALIQSQLTPADGFQRAVAWYVEPSDPEAALTVADIPPQASINDTVIDISKDPWVVYQIGA